MADIGLLDMICPEEPPMAEDLTTRRAFLHRGLTLAGTAATVPTFLNRSALAIAPQAGGRRKASGEKDAHVLVVIQLAGGNDGLNTVIPVRNDHYRQARPRLAIDREEALRLDDDYALHASMTGMKALYDEGMLAIVHGVGYPNPNRSHFKSMDIWHSASPDGREHTGWLGRYFDHQCAGSDPCPPESGIAIMKEMPGALRGESFMPVAFDRPETLSWTGEKQGKRRNRRRGNKDQQRAEALKRAFDELNAPDQPEEETPTELEYLQRSAMNARITADEIRRHAAGKAPVAYPNSGLARALNSIGRMIAAEMPTTIYYANHTGFDTHTGQNFRHAQLLTQFSDALSAFMKDLKATGHLDRVTVMTFSEFGRRVKENASGGTDHGEAAPMFVAGSKIRAGFHGTPPSLEPDKLNRGDLAWTTDFRSVYAAMLDDWLGENPQRILGRGVRPLKLFTT